MNQYQKENNELVNGILEDYFYKAWRGEKDSKDLELIISGYCNLGCRYCYINNFGHKLFPHEIRSNKKTLENAGLVFDWAIKNKYSFDRVELFSGEIFNQKIGHDVIRLMIEKYKKASDDARRFDIMIPTNFTFMLDPELEKQVQSYIDEFKAMGIRMHLSASFDGIILESLNRPFAGNLDLKIQNTIRDESYYDKVFSFIAKNHCGLHPMVYSQGIEHWKDTFLWFQDMMQSHGIQWGGLYLLQVRNAEWTKAQNIHLKEFIRFLYHWVDEKLNSNKKAVVDFITNNGFNIMRSGIGSSRRGLPCAIQLNMAIRLADLAFVPCHRLMYDGLNYGRMIVENGEITGKVEALNPEFLIGILSAANKASPYCNVCRIKNSCIGGCLGSQLEVTGDPFTPIPSMCAMQHALMAGIIEGATDIGVYPMLMSKMNEYQAFEHELIRKEIEENGGRHNG